MDSGAVPVLHMESWPPGGACFGTTELCGQTVSKVSCVDGIEMKNGINRLDTTEHRFSLI